MRRIGIPAGPDRNSPRKSLHHAVPDLLVGERASTDWPWARSPCTTDPRLRMSRCLADLNTEDNRPRHIAAYRRMRTACPLSVRRLKG